MTVATGSRKVRKFRGGDYVAALMAELSRAAIAQRIATARKQAGLDQHELADVLGVHWRTVQDWESPKKQTTPWDRLGEVAAVTGVTKDWLLHGEREGAEVDAEMLVRRLEALEDGQDDLRRMLARLLEVVDRLAPQENRDAPTSTRSANPAR